ncbi:MAG: cyanophycin synthetase [Gemmataceae bacterium]
MEFKRIWTLRGPNIWARVPVFEAELVAPVDFSTAARQQLAAWLPGLGAVLPSWAVCVERAALLLQQQAGSPVQFSTVQETPAFQRVIVEFEEEALGRACLEKALELCTSAAAGKEVDSAAALRTLRALGHDVRLGPSTAAIVRAARARNIPFRRLNEGSLIQLGQGTKQRRICTAETDRTGAIAESIAQDKQLTRGLLKAIGVPVPTGRPVADEEDAWQAATELAVPVVVKPQYGNHGRGVATNLTSREQVLHAFRAAREEGSSILVETFAPGDDYRLLVVNGTLVAAACREPAQVIGDGRSTIEQLVEIVNRDPRRSDGHSTVLSFIKLDAIGLQVLAEQGHSPTSVPAAGEKVLIRRNGNLSTGGTATDVTDQVHPETARRAVEAAGVIGLDIAGIDVVALDISQPLDGQGAAVVEVNAGPGLRMHLEPSAGQPRAVGAAIVDSLYPPGCDGRIPIVAVTGVNGKTTTTRLLAHLLRASGHTVGMTCTDGTYINERRIEARDCSGPQSARAVLLNPLVDAAVFETARGGLLREGLGFDECNVAIVTNIGGGDHLGLRGIETLDQLARVKRVVVEAVARTGAAVLNAADPLVADMAQYCPGKVILFARAESAVKNHLARGELALFIRAGSVVQTQGGSETVLLPLADVPLTHGGRVPFQVDNVLAALAACCWLGLPMARVCEGLRSFTGSPEQSPGRFNVLTARDSHVIVDFAHNPTALAALVEALTAFAQPRRTVVFCAFNRSDAEVIELGKILGDAFDRVILYRDRDNRERADGELNALLRKGLEGRRRTKEVVELPDERQAIDAALAELGPERLVVIGIEEIEGTLSYLRDQLLPI